MEAKAPVRIGELLIHIGLLTEGDLMEASHVAVDLGLPLGRALVMSEYITDAELKAIIQAQSMLKDSIVDMQTVANAMKIVGQSQCSFDDALAQCGYTQRDDAQRNKLGDLLVEAGVMSQDELYSALSKAQEAGLPLGRVLASQGRLSAQLLHAGLNAQVLLRDGRITRAQAVNALRSTYTKQTSFEQELAEQGSYQPPSGARLKIGELFVLAGILSEEIVLDALQICLETQKLIGEVLLEKNLISPQLLEAALRLQEGVDKRGLTPLTAAEALRRVHTRNVNVDRAMAEMGLLRSPSAERIRIGELLLAAGAITQEQLQDAVKIAMMNNALIGKVLLISNYIDQHTLYNALRCQFLIREGLLQEEQVASLLQYCHHRQITVDDAMNEANAQQQAGNLSVAGSEAQG